MRKNKVIVYLAFGDEHVSYAAKSMRSVEASNDFGGSVILLTDNETSIPDHLPKKTKVVRADFSLEGLARKSEMLKFLPEGVDSYLYLDSDTQVLLDISLGFEKAETHGIAVAQAPHYSLDHFWGFDKIMRLEGVQPKGQLQYNTGVIFFSLTAEVIEVFKYWKDLAEKYAGDFDNDQPFFTLAMEKLNFNPYVLSPSYNHRASGQLISGVVRIWHSYKEVPEDLNCFTQSWPPRRIENEKVVYVKDGAKAHPLQRLERRLTRKLESIRLLISRGKSVLKSLRDQLIQTF